MRIKKVDIFFIIALVILTLISIDLLLNISHQEALTNIWDNKSYQEAAILVTVEALIVRLSIVFIVCFIGNLLPFPSPYPLAVCLGFAYLAFNPLLPFLFVFVGAFGCLIGEMVGYIIGRGTAEIISEERANNLSKYEAYIVEHPHLVPFLIFIAALTPINDDTITIPAGLLKVGFRKTVFWCFLGKLCLMLVFAYNLLNICNLIVENWILSIATLYFIIIIVYILIRIDIFKKINK